MELSLRSDTLTGFAMEQKSGTRLASNVAVLPFCLILESKLLDYPIGKRLYLRLFFAPMRRPSP